MRLYSRIIDYWFGHIEDHPEDHDHHLKVWFAKNPETDEYVTEYFREDLEQATLGKFDDWVKEPEGRLALIILLDQFSRHIFRDTEQAFMNDAKALQIAMEGIECGDDTKMSVFKRLFFYLPFQHAENKAVQQQSVELYQQLLADAPEKLKPFFQVNLDYAEAHKRIIDRFGHFPHRNKFLGRQSTPEEVEFLQQPGSSF